MEKIRTGKLNPRALELPIKIQPIERAQKVTLKRLNYLLGVLSEKYPEAIQLYVVNLQSRYQSLTISDHVYSSGIDLASLMTDLTHLAHYKDAATAYMNYYLELLDPKTHDNWAKNTIEVPNENYLKAFLYPHYYNLQVLTETLSRDEAIKLWKQYITHYIIDNRTQKNTATGVEEILERRIGGNRNDSEWVLVHGIIADGKYAYKNENCTWVEAMKELPDNEFKYYVCCYGDYEHAKSYDENIVLTMEHTIAEGDPYCSRVLHDTRVNWKLEHPSKEFWDGFNPE